MLQLWSDRLLLKNWFPMEALVRYRSSALQGRVFPPQVFTAWAGVGGSPSVSSAPLFWGRVSPVRVYQFCSGRGKVSSVRRARSVRALLREYPYNQEPRNTTKSYYTAKLSSEIYWEGKTRERLLLGRSSRELSRRQGFYRISGGRGISRLTISRVWFKFPSMSKIRDCWVFLFGDWWVSVSCPGSWAWGQVRVRMFFLCPLTLHSFRIES